jgi:hypothetical protein
MGKLLQVLLSTLLTIAALEKLVLVLRDGRKLIGVLRSWDQFGQFTCHDLLAIALARYRRIYRENL